MNPRIKELAAQAGLSHMPSNYPDMADLYKGADFELEKFAELIIRECAELADNCPYEYLMEPYKYQSTYILEHFGIEHDNP